MKKKATKALDWYGRGYDRVMSFIFGPIVNPIVKRMGDPMKWSRKTILKALLVGVLLSKIGIWGSLIAFVMLTDLFWVPYLLFVTITIGWSTILILAFVGLARAGIIKEGDEWP